MANSNRRDRESETAHHLISRIAHRVYFLKEDERKDFLEMVRRAADFSGIRLLGWCVMTNHFHILAYLPARERVAEDEVLRRYGVLKGQAALAGIEKELSEWRKSGDEARVEEWLDSQRRRMYDIGSFMKIVKQWFTEEYNRRNAHKGTLWESAYYDRVVPAVTGELAKCLGYIHLNPIRAAATDEFDGYHWSSFSAFMKGDPTAVCGMRFVYGDGCSIREIAERHTALLEELLEAEKRRRAEEIARKRAAGYVMPTDHLTTEAMVAQRAAHLADMQQASMELQESRLRANRRADRRDVTEKGICALLEASAGMEMHRIAERLSLGKSMTYRILGDMKKRGLVVQEGHGGVWHLPNSGI